MSPFEIKHHIFSHVESYCKGSSLCDQCEFATEPLTPQNPRHLASLTLFWNNTYHIAEVLELLNLRSYIDF